MKQVLDTNMLELGFCLYRLYTISSTLPCIGSGKLERHTVCSISAEHMVCHFPAHGLMVMQVVHHPTIVAMHGEGERWSYTADADVRAKFWGRSVELIPVGLIRLRFDDGDEYEWAKVMHAACCL